MGAAAFCAPDRRVQADSCLREHVVEFERLSEIAVEHHRSVGNGNVDAHHGDDLLELARAFRK